MPLNVAVCRLKKKQQKKKTVDYSESCHMAELDRFTHNSLLILSEGWRKAISPRIYTEKHFATFI